MSHPQGWALKYRIWLANAAILAMLLSAPAAAVECDAAGIRPTVNLRIDNDLFGGQDQDQGYSNGLLVTLVSPNLLEYRDDPCLPRIARWISRHLDWLQPGDFEQLNMVASFGQALFTPEDREPAGLIEDDRPFAAALLFNVGYNARRGDHMRTSLLRLGIVGPSARGEEVQNGWHDIIGVDRFNGWDHQLRDEPVVQLVHERMQRRTLPPAFERVGLQQDFISHWGGAVGNLGTHANVGAEWRIGWHCQMISAVRHCAQPARTPPRHGGALPTDAGPATCSPTSTHAGCSTTSPWTAIRGRTAIASTSVRSWPMSASASP